MWVIVSPSDTHFVSTIRFTQILQDSKWLQWSPMVDHVGLCCALTMVRSKPKALFRVGMRRFLSSWSAKIRRNVEMGKEGLRADRNWGPKWNHDIWSLFECWNMSTKDVKHVNIWRPPRPSYMVGTGCSEKTVPNPAFPNLVLRCLENIDWARALSDSKSLFVIVVGSCWIDLWQRSHKIVFICFQLLSKVCEQEKLWGPAKDLSGLLDRNDDLILDD